MVPLTINQEAILVCYNELKPTFYENFLSFYLMYFFSFSIHDTIWCFAFMSWLWHFLRLSFFLVTVAVLRNSGLVFCRMYLNWDLYDIFLMLKMGLWLCVCFWGEGRGGRTQKRDAIFITSFKSIYYQHDLWLLTLTLTIWLRWCLSGFFIVKILPNLLFLLYPSEEVPIHSPLSVCGSYSSFLGVGVCT